MRNDLFLKMVANNVKKARQSKGLSVRKLGEMCGLDYSNISRFENGQKNIHLQHLKAISDALKMDVKEMIS